MYQRIDPLYVEHEQDFDVSSEGPSSGISHCLKFVIYVRIYIFRQILQK